MPDVVIEPRPSVRLRAGLVALHLLAGAAVWACSLPPAATLLLAGVIVLSLIRSSGRAVGRIRRVERHGERWFLTDEQGTIHDTVLSHWFVHPRLLVLSFRGDGRHRDVVVLPDDAAGADDLRRLRRHLLDRQRTEELGDEMPGA